MCIITTYNSQELKICSIMLEVKLLVKRYESSSVLICIFFGDMVVFGCHVVTSPLTLLQWRIRSCVMSAGFPSTQPTSSQPDMCAHTFSPSVQLFQALELHHQKAKHGTLCHRPWGYTVADRLGKLLQLCQFPHDHRSP